MLICLPVNIKKKVSHHFTGKKEKTPQKRKIGNLKNCYLTIFVMHEISDNKGTCVYLFQSITESLRLFPPHYRTIQYSTL